jgi:ceramide glucosyltransferase
MRADVRSIAEKLALAAALASTGYAAFALQRLLVFERRAGSTTSAPERGRSPAVTILKPARGDEPGLEENLASFCAQDYPDFHVVFGTLDPADPALTVMRRVAARYPARATVVSGDGVARHRNPKMATLEPMIASARGDILVIADSDMRVGPDYLAAIVAPFDDPHIGALTCIFRGEPVDGGIASVLAAMAITEQFMPSAILANAIEPMTYCFGSTMAVRRDVFDAIGGIAALGSRLADDYALGSLVVAHGYRVELSPYVVTNVVSEPGLQHLIEHELRWARTIRGVRLVSYAGLILTYPLPLALLHLAVARKRRPVLALVALVAGLRFALHARAHRTFRTRRRPPAWLIPVRDALGVLVWGLGLFGGRVRWRGEDYRMSGSGRLTPNQTASKSITGAATGSEAPS